jgi:hypothetical protein
VICVDHDCDGASILRIGVHHPDGASIAKAAGSDLKSSSVRPFVSFARERKARLIALIQMEAHRRDSATASDTCPRWPSPRRQRRECGGTAHRFPENPYKMLDHDNQYNEFLEKCRHAVTHCSFSECGETQSGVENVVMP